MDLKRRSFTGLVLAMAGAQVASAQDDAALAWYREAKINWR